MTELEKEKFTDLIKKKNSINMDLNIRKATKKDLEFIYELYVTNSVEEVKQNSTKLDFPKKTKNSRLTELTKHEKRIKKSFLAELNQSDVIFVIAEFENKPIGFGQGIVEPVRECKSGFLIKIFLNKNNKGKGFRTKIAQYLIQEMKKQDIEFVEWQCLNSNKDSVKLAEKLGFKPFCTTFRKKVKRASGYLKCCKLGEKI